VRDFTNHPYPLLEKKGNRFIQNRYITRRKVLDFASRRRGYDKP